MAKKTTTTRKTSTRKTSTRKAAAPRAGLRDAENNKGMAIIAYLIFFIPLLTGDSKKSPFVRFHTNQGFVLFLFAVILMIVWSIIWSIFIGGIYYSFSWGLWRFLSLISWLLWLAIAALCIIGIINAANGKMKPLPVIGKFTIIK